MYDSPQLRRVGAGSTALKSFPKENGEPGREEAGGWEAREMDPCCSPGARGAEGVEGGRGVLTGQREDGGDAEAWRQVWPGALTALPLPCAYPGPH